MKYTKLFAIDNFSFRQDVVRAADFKVNIIGPDIDLSSDVYDHDLGYFCDVWNYRTFRDSSFH